LITSWQFWVGLAISLVCLVLALRDVDLNGVLLTLYQVNAGWLILAVLSVLATFVTKSIRWKFLFHASNRPSLKRAFSIQAIGMLLNTFVPARMGDLARAYLMGEAERKSKVYTLGTVIVEKFIDLLSVFLILLFLLTQIALPGWLAGSPLRLGTGLFIGVILIGVLVWKGDRVLVWGQRLFTILPNAWADWLANRTQLGLQSLEVFRQPGQLLWVIFWTLVSWLLALSTNTLVFAAMGLHLSLWVALVLLVVLQVGVALPSSPGRIGVFHYLTLITLLYFSVGREAALGCGVILHLVVIGPIGIVGVASLWWEKVTWKTLAEAAKKFGDLLKRAT
jgi:uncharacterized protein (TIRG00374 family)